MKKQSARQSALEHAFATRGGKKRAIEFATRMRTRLERKAQAESKFNGVRMEEADAIKLFKPLPTITALYLDLCRKIMKGDAISVE